jgi:uncharacterized protein
MSDPTTAPPSRPVLSGYGNGGFRINGEWHGGSVVLLPDSALPWLPANIAALTVEDFSAVVLTRQTPEILIVGCGRRAVLIPPVVRQHLREAGIVVDAMDTGAACRTYNVLVGEARNVAAALLAIE